MGGDSMRRHTRSRVLSLLAASTVLLAACSSSSTPPANNAGASTTTTAEKATKGNATKGDVQQGIAGAPAAASGLSGPITVGLDFKPETDGFGFENYGKNPPDRPN